jgi:hypothetical protein
LIAVDHGDFWLRIPATQAKMFVDRDKKERPSFVFWQEAELVSKAYDMLSQSNQ